jgi:plastocyanin
MPPIPRIVTVIIPEGSSVANSDHNNFEPETIKVVIRVNNTVRWVSQDVTSCGIRASSMDDPDFFNATEGDASFLDPGETFDFTFNVPGVFDYHCEPHPHKHGTVLVLEPKK